MKKITIILVFLLNSVCILAQSTDKPVDLESIPNEKIYMHTNSTMLLVGEYLYFNVYCLNAKTNQPSEISKTAYVELISSEGERVIRQVIDLKDGIGSSDYFIQTSVGSGNYKLIAHTSWMQNNKYHRIFEQDVFIINPYTSAQAKVRKDSVVGKVNNHEFDKTSTGISLNHSSFGKREEVIVDLGNYGIKKGNYSISVRKIGDIPSPSINTTKEFLEKYTDYEYSYRSRTETKLPDLRGKLISGRIIPKTSGIPLNNQQLTLSVPGADYFLKTAATDRKGRFYFSVDESFIEEDAFIQVFGKNRDKYDFEFNETEFEDIKELSFADYGITAAMKQEIIDRSVHNQIENAYFSLKPDTIKTTLPDNLFEGVERVEYVLDDYRRFKTIQETFVEIIPYGRIRKNQGDYEISVLGYEPKMDFEGMPLLVVDGLPVQEVDDFVRNYDSRKIEKISIIRSKYYLGSMFYKGVILVETLNKEFTESYRYDYLEDFKISSGVSEKNYFKQDYSLKSSPNVPDFRTQLLWDPNIQFKGNKDKFNFYTSDVSGNFQIIIQGFQNDGKPVSITKTFEVK
ncbi:hypothetical protein [Christiangramia sp. SM2212]|uniref:Uncharacterized protein n=1 Tax=Christiangramia sediminicola TaxID=3073267 RepID=A0ABU1EPX8_9FLAO|nr:hypothetical protein [Christiangramia sp. SM2212]MDR5590437.1 hypothetical protein [Christiangramia sp. SM2212]